MNIFSQSHNQLSDT